MRGFALLILCLASACTNEDVVPAFVAMDYQVRCIGSCSKARDGRMHRISNVDGEDGLTLTCDVQVEEGERLLSFRLACAGGDSACGEEEYSLEISEISLEQGNKITKPGSRCEVKVTEQDTEYLGGCTGGDPDPEDGDPCSIRLDIDGSFVEGTLLCEELPARLAPTMITRFIVAPATSDDPASFTLEGCVGL
ncbi:MAG: hypothetical protein OXU20_37910 [Myxococcales bacterium]|nr:hypothetical protein [Myxococcales bacterium]